MATDTDDVTRARASQELRNLTSAAITAFEVLRTGQAAIGGNTGSVLQRSLMAIQALIDRSLPGGRPPRASSSESANKAPGSEREQTDESLRVERERADQAIGAELDAIDAVADAVINLARARADELLASARATTDHVSANSPASARFPRIIDRERKLEDQVLRDERANADTILRQERAEHVALLSSEREDTDQYLTNERARSDEALTTRDVFLGIVSHDLRNLLNAVVGFAAFIGTEVSRDNHVEAVRRHAVRIQQAGTRMGRLVGDLVDVASIEAGTLAVSREVGDPVHTVMEAVDTFQAHAMASGVSLMAEVTRPSSFAAFDAARILQVLTNLLSNAIKFTPAHGRVVVHVEDIGEEIRFAVSDNGVGIPADKLDAVFGRFHQLAPNDRRGAGLGLYISKCIVQGHGGRIWAESTIGEGSTVCFTLPIHVATDVKRV